MGYSNSIMFSSENLLSLSSNVDVSTAAVGMTSLYGNSIMFSSILYKYAVCYVFLT
jgi:hypothetical protein